MLSKAKPYIAPYLRTGAPNTLHQFGNIIIQPWAEIHTGIRVGVYSKNAEAYNCLGFAGRTKKNRCEQKGAANYRG